MIRHEALVLTTKYMYIYIKYILVHCVSNDTKSAIEGVFIYLIQIQYSWLYPGHVHHLFNLINGAW